MYCTNLAYHLDRTADPVKPVSIIQDNDRLSPSHHCCPLHPTHGTFLERARSELYLFILLSVDNCVLELFAGRLGLAGPAFCEQSLDTLGDGTQ